MKLTAAALTTCVLVSATFAAPLPEGPEDHLIGGQDWSQDIKIEPDFNHLWKAQLDALGSFPTIDGLKAPAWATSDPLPSLEDIQKVIDFQNTYFDAIHAVEEAQRQALKDFVPLGVPIRRDSINGAGSNFDAMPERRRVATFPETLPSELMDLIDQKDSEQSTWQKRSGEDEPAVPRPRFRPMKASPSARAGLVLAK